MAVGARGRHVEVFDLGVDLVDRGTVRVEDRSRDDVDSCTRDVLAALPLAALPLAARRAITMDHSFGGAPAVRAGVLADELRSRRLGWRPATLAP